MDLRISRTEYLQTWRLWIWMRDLQSVCREDKGPGHGPGPLSIAAVIVNVDWGMRN